MKFRNSDEAEHYGPKIASIADSLDNLLKHYEMSGHHVHEGGSFPGDCVACNARIALAVAEGRDLPSKTELARAELAARANWHRNRRSLQAN